MFVFYLGSGVRDFVGLLKFCFVVGVGLTVVTYFPGVTGFGALLSVLMRFSAWSGPSIS